MAQLVETPAAVPGVAPKKIDEYVGHVNTGTQEVSIARMQSPQGWSEPGQTPEFDEYTVVLSGSVVVEDSHGRMQVQAGQAVVAPRGQWVRYSTPNPGGAEYIAVCVPGFTLESAHRDPES